MVDQRPISCNKAQGILPRPSWTTDGRWSTLWAMRFFSVGPDCVVARADCRVDAMEQYMDWLPAEDDPVYGSMYRHMHWPRGDEPRKRDLCAVFFYAGESVPRVWSGLAHELARADEAAS